jgi:HPt (histidine-containing phosphotransfer) domain-containing protein
VIEYSEGDQIELHSIKEMWKRNMVCPLPDIPDLDIRNGLKRVCGNEILYRKLLVELFQECESIVKEVNAALKSDQYKTAIRRVHSVKGSAGNLGAAHLARSAEDLEIALKQKRVSSHHLETFEYTINVILFGLQDFYETQSKDTANLSLPVFKRNEGLLKQFQHLDNHIHQHKALRCKNILEEIKRQGFPSTLHPHLVSLSTHIENYNFEEGKKELDKLIVLVQQKKI